MKGWYGNKRQHCLASKGIKTAYGIPKPYGNMSTTERLKYLVKTSQEWLDKFEETSYPAEIEEIKGVRDVAESILYDHYDNPLEYAQDDLDEDIFPVAIEYETEGGMIKKDGIWIIDIRPLQFGTVIWQDAMIENIIIKTKANVELDTMDEVFLKTQKEHNYKILKQKELDGTLTENDYNILQIMEGEQL